jgi:hypothetical protein
VAASASHAPALPPASAGGVVLVRGTLRIDKDYGAGYVYPVIIEEVRVSK